MKKLLLTAVLALTSTNTLAISAYEYCSKFSKLGGDAVEIRSQGHTKDEVLSELSKTSALTTVNRQLIELVYSMPMTSDLQGDIANVKRVVFSICMDSMEQVMPRYSVKADGLTVIFKAKSQREAIYKAYLISPFYSDLKRLESRWWLLIYPVLVLLGYYIGVELL